jgi:uncharacterized C2H2 Zn-finger protein
MTLVYTGASVAGLLEDKQPWKNWQKRRVTASKSVRAETDHKMMEPVEVDFSKYTPEKFLLSWCTIVAGVERFKPGHGFIHPHHSKWLNENGNGWFNDLLLESYPSFIMAENYLEHIQVSRLSKGKILDAVAWVASSNKVPTVFVDILVATNRKHRRLVEQIQAKKIKAMSMGCDVTHFQCSKCEKIYTDDDDRCHHVENSAGRYFERDGAKLRIGEMCGVAGKPDTCRFVEASWVVIPAFTPAIRHGDLKIGTRWLGRPLRAFIPTFRQKEASRDD